MQDLSTIRHELFRWVWRIFTAVMALLTVINGSAWVLLNLSHDGRYALRDGAFLLLLLLMPRLAIIPRYIAINAGIMAYLLLSLTLDTERFAILLSTYTILYTLPIIISGLLLGWKAMIPTALTYFSFYLFSPLFASPSQSIQIGSVISIILVITVLTMIVAFIETLYRNLETLVMERTATINKQREDLIRSEQRKQAFFQHIRHHFNTPLATLSGANSLLPFAIDAIRTSNDLSLMDEIRSMFTTGISRTSLLTQRLIDIAMISTDQPIRLVWSDTTVEYLFASIQTLLDTNNNRLIVELPEVSIACTVDVQRMEQALTICCELILNALDEEARVNLSVHVSHTPQRIVILLHTDRSDISTLQPFLTNRLISTTHDHVSHDGMSLLLVQRILIAHHGNVQIKQDRSYGTQLGLWFPVQPLKV